MTQVSNPSQQVVAVNSDLIFSTVLLHKGCGECCNPNNRLATLVAIRNAGVYELQFNGNVSSPTAGTPVQLILEVNGVPLPETLMVSTTTTANALNNVSARTRIDNCGGRGALSVTVRNIGTVAATVAANPSLMVFRVS